LAGLQYALRLGWRKRRIPVRMVATANEETV